MPKETLRSAAETLPPTANTPAPAKPRQETGAVAANLWRMMQDAEPSQAHYDALQLPPGSSAQQVHAQYRRLAKQFHPDRNPHRREWAEERLRVLNQAYHALAHAQAQPSAPEQSRTSAPPVPPAAAAPRPRPRPNPARRALRYGAVVCLVCGVSVAYTTWSQTLQSAPLASVTSAAPAPTVSANNDSSAPIASANRDGSAPMASAADDASTPTASPNGDAPAPAATINSDAPAPAAPISEDTPAPAAPVFGDASAPQAPIISDAPLPVAPGVGTAHAPDAAAGRNAARAHALPGGITRHALALRFVQENAGVDQAVAQASRIVSHVNAPGGHAPQSRRPLRAEQLAADALELSRLQRSIRGELSGLRAPASPDLHHAQVADLQLALAQMQKQAHLVRADLASFPAK